MVVLASIFVVFSCVIVTVWYIKYLSNKKLIAHIKGPTVFPILGNAFHLRSSTKILPSLMKLLKRYNWENFRIFIGSQPYIFINNEKDLECVLSSSVPIKKSFAYDFLRDWLGSGLLTSSGDKWRKHRKILTPAFHFKILEDFIDVFNACGEKFVERLSTELGKDSFDIYPYVTRCTLDIICETAMGVSVNAQDGYNAKYVKAVTNMVQLVSERSFSPILQHDLLYQFSLPAFRERRDLKILHGFTEEVIRRRKLELKQNTDGKTQKELDTVSVKSTESNSSCMSGISIDTIGRKTRKAFLDLLIEYSLGDFSFTDQDIREEVDTFMFEGHDTTATSIAFVLYSLATNQHVQQTAYDETREIFSDDPKRRATYRDLQRMKYLEKVIKESLRMYSTVPLYGRELTEDFDLNGVTIPKGFQITVFSYGVQHNPNVYKDPELFDPERFSAENSSGRGPFAYVPFSAGPRNCIGQKFAMLEMKATVSHVLRSYKILPATPVRPVKLRCDIVLKSDNGVRVRLEERV